MSSFPPAKDKAAPERRVLFAILGIAFLLRLLAALAMSVHHPDEIGQYLEQAHRIAFGNGVVPWEYRTGLRSWLMPVLLAGPMKIGALISNDPAVYLFAVRAALCVVALGPVIGAWLIGRRWSVAHASVAAFAVATWWELIYFGVHPLSESVAVAAILPAAGIVFQRRIARRDLVIAGFLLGIATLLRIQYLPAILILAGCAIAQERARFTPIACGLALAAIAGSLIDLWAGMMPFQWALTNIGQNLVADRASGYGVSGMLAYLKGYADYWHWVLFAMLWLALIGMQRARPLAIAAAVTLVLHMLIPHKEYRFILLTTCTIVILAALASLDMLRSIRRAPKLRRHAVIMLCAAWALTSLTLALIDPQVKRWTAFGNAFAATREIANDPGACGIFVADRADILWLSTYTALHRAVPIGMPVDHPTLPPLSRVAPGANWIIADAADAPPPPPGYERRQCYTIGEENMAALSRPGTRTLCTFHRPGRCDPAALARWEINGQLIAHNR